MKEKTLAFVKKQRYGVLALSAVLMLGVLAGSVFMPIKPAQAAQETCPAGTYQIAVDSSGKPVCKNEPTGCPFGDSVPLDKCTPPPDIECNADWSQCHPKKQDTKPTTPVTNPAQPVTTPQETTTPVNTCVSK